MKKLIYIIIIILSVTLTSCEKDLDQSNPNVVNKNDFWSTENDVISGLSATYKVFRNVNNGYWGVRGVELANGRGDDFYIRNDVKALYQLSTFTNKPTTNVPSGIFSACYTGIFWANQIIANTPNTDISEKEKSEVIAEAKFLRAINYFHLVINFGSVPIINTVPEKREDYFVKKSSKEEVWQQLISDLQIAQDSLPVSYSEKWVGRATKGAAIGFLGKAYVYQKQWAKAEKEFEIIVGPNGNSKSPFDYELMANYEDNFKAANDNNKESLFEIQNQNVGGDNPWAGENANEAQGVTTAQEFAPPEVSGWFEAYPTNKIFNAFKKEKTISGDYDPRMYASIVWDYPGAMFYNRPFSDYKLQFGYKSMIRKYQNWRQDNEGIWISNINEKVLRFDNILLLNAEALTMQGKVTEAYAFINKIRNRAKLADLKTGLSQDKLMAEIRHQRMIEFFREGQRFYDLRRWGLLKKEIENSDKVGKQYFNLSKHGYFPIPQDELNTNPNMKQNPNW